MARWRPKTGCASRLGRPLCELCPAVRSLFNLVVGGCRWGVHLKAHPGHHERIYNPFNLGGASKAQNKEEIEKRPDSGGKGVTDSP